MATELFYKLDQSLDIHTYVYQPHPHAYEPNFTEPTPHQLNETIQNTYIQIKWKDYA